MRFLHVCVQYMHNVWLMLKSMAPNFCKNVFNRDNGDYGVKTDIGVFQLLLGASCFKLALLWFVSTL